MNFLEKCISIAMTVASRGISNQKVSIVEKQLRGISCFGTSEIPQCEHLKLSTNGKTHHCGACGCGDKPFTQLTLNGKNYSKLDYPYLKCPLEMPGFSNYSPASPKEVHENSRKAKIELYDIINLNELSVSSPDPSDYEYKLFQKLTKFGEYQDSK